MKKSRVIQPKRARPRLRTNGNKSQVGPRPRNTVSYGEILLSAMPKLNCGVTRSFSIHFPEGGVITLTFQLTQAGTGTKAFDQEVYQLTDIGLNLKMVKLNPEAIVSIVQELKSVSLRHTS